MIKKIKGMQPSRLNDNNRWKYKIILHSFLVGILAGGIIVVYRLLGDFLFGKVKNIYGMCETNPFMLVAVLGGLIVMALFVAQCIKKEPNISGSGIPQVEGMITHQISTNWKSVLIYKFLGGIVALAVGLSVGREGPSIQMGASVGEGISRRLNEKDYEHKYLLTSGASAGLAAAFNAPLAGVMFALEEVHKNFSPIVLFSAMISAITADMITKSIIGIKPTLAFEELKIMPIKYYWGLLLLGLFLGVCGFFFNHGIVKAKRLYRRMPIKLEFKIMISFIFAGMIGITIPALLGGGHHLIENLNSMNIGIGITLLFLVIKFFYTLMSFGSGVPGGIFLPLLAIGALAGNLVGLICTDYLGLPPEYLINFSVLAMAGSFAAIVKAPITGIILIFEMTGSFEQLLPLSLVVFIAIITSDLLQVEPVYHMLLEDIVDPDADKEDPKELKKTLVELTVEVGSLIEGKALREIELPMECLIVQINRGSKEIVPKGDTVILAGDLLTVLSTRKDASGIIKYLSLITSHV